MRCRRAARLSSLPQRALPPVESPPAVISHQAQQQPKQQATQGAWEQHAGRQVSGEGLPPSHRILAQTWLQSTVQAAKAPSGCHTESLFKPQSFPQSRDRAS